MPTTTPFINFKLKDLVRERDYRPPTDTEVHSLLSVFAQEQEAKKALRLKESKRLRKNLPVSNRRSPNAIIERKSKG
jgi:hypothetical protein